jgi:uncharacterized protein YecT (DUF1311 family)
VLLSAMATVGAGPPARAASSRLAKLSPPVISEQFTVLPCPRHPQSTLELEGCEERRVVSTDRMIDRLLAAIFPRLFDDAARRRLIAAHRAWLAYRKADCTSISDRYEGGTLAGLLAASCTADRSAQRLKDLRAFERLLHRP